MSEGRPTISREDVESRVERIQGGMGTRGIDACFVYGGEYRPEYLRYVSNCWPIFSLGALVIPREGEPIVVAAPEGADVARERSAWQDIRLTESFGWRASRSVTVGAQNDLPPTDVAVLREIFAEIQGRQSVRTVAIVGTDAMSPRVHWALEAVLSGVALLDVNDLVDSLRLIKSPAEIACLKEAGRLADLAYVELMAACVPGCTECQAAGVAEGAARAAGAERIPFTLFGSGQRTDIMMGRASHKIIQEGDMIMAALAVQYEGYIATVGMPFVAGTGMTDAQQSFIDALVVADNKALTSLRHGVPARDLVRSVRAHFEARGLSMQSVYAPLHGVGLTEAEAPYPDENDPLLFANGMAINVDISLFRSPVGSNRIEEGFVVREGAPEPLSPLICRLRSEWLGR